ncbi:MAG: response regulator [Pirellulaceae bacterium]|nr:response regulator [Pirellulaceae bacterium]
MAEFTPHTYNILIVEDRADWRRALKAMYTRLLFGTEQDCQNIYTAATAAEAVDLMTSRPQFFNLVSLDINLGSRESLGIHGMDTSIAVTGLDVLDKVKSLQRGAALIVVSGASSDSELPAAFSAGDKEGIARARITLGSELQSQFETAFRYFPKAPLEETTVVEQIAYIERQLSRASLFKLTELRKSQLVAPELPSLCVMIVLDDAYFEGHDEKGTLFADPRQRVVRFDFFEECLKYLAKVKIWKPWPDPDEFGDVDSFKNAAYQFYCREAQEAFDTALEISKGFVVLRSKPDTAQECAAPKSTTTINKVGSPNLTDVHQDFLLSIARSKIINAQGGPAVGDNNEKKTASELRKRLRETFQLRTDELDPVLSKHPKNGKKLSHYDVKMQVFLCSTQYINPPKPKQGRRRKQSLE